MGINYGSLPFKQQIDFFNAKTPMPSEHWYDVQREMHDTGFMVAGATKADLLADIKAAMQKAHQQGTTLAEFRKDFDKIVEDRGWTGWTGSETEAGRAWRTRIIYETNLRTSYQAGRWQQVQAVSKTRPYLIYKHSHSVLSPRAEHVSWDGLVVRQDDPWVKTHWPPNGYGCKCTMFTLSERDLQRMGKSGPDTPPDDGTYDWKDPNTGELHTFPKGIQPFWDYTPGASLTERVRGQIERKIESLPADIGQQLGALIKSTSGKLEQSALELGVKTADYAQRADIAKAVNASLREIKTYHLSMPDHVVVSSDAFITWADKLGDVPENFPAAFVPHKNGHETYLFVNPLYQHWHDPDADAEIQFTRREWSTRHPYHAIRHELGHLQHYLTDKAAYQAALAAPFSVHDQRVAAKVSGYAATLPAEFVAEVFAGLMNGQHFDAEIMALYQTLKGPAL